jgi:phage terminase large subunit
MTEFKPIIIKKELISKHFENVILSKDRYLVAFGGRGSGKTKHLYLKYIFESFQTNHFTLLYVNKEFTNIRDQQYLGFKNTIRDLGMSDCFKFYDGDYRIQNLITKNWFIPKGMDNAEKTKGIEDITNIWIDEANKCTLEDITTLDKLLRTPKAQYFQLAVSFNPVSEKHWLRNYFFDNSGYNAKENFKSILINHSNYSNNDFIDKEAYKDTIINGSNGDPSRLECDLYGRWGNIRPDNLFIYALNRERNVTKEIPFREDVRQYISIDFNANPMTAIVAQVGYCRNLKTDYIEIIEEIVLREKSKSEGVGVYEMCDYIKNRYDVEWCDFVGDASGWNRNVNSRGAKSSWEIINEELNLSKNQNKTPKGKKGIIGKGYVSDKRNITNYLLQRYPRFKIASNCVHLLDDIESVQSTEDGHMAKEKDKNKSHLLDCLCDLLITLVRYKIIDIDISILKPSTL